MRKLFSFFLLIWAGTTFAQDTSFVKSAYGGSSLTVPEGVSWKIEKAYINGGDGYNILVSNSNFKPVYTSGEKLQTPYYMAEMELLDKKDGVVFYILYIRQQINK
ncbi:MAG: hypothetical protein RLZZ382_1387 [Bacteroidota bacterium]